MISSSKLGAYLLCTPNLQQRCLLHTAIQKRHFNDHQPVWRQVGRRSGVFCCSVRILLLIILPLHRHDDNKIFLLTASFFYFACHGSSCKWTQMTNKKVAHFVPLPCFHWHISCRFRTFDDITETPGSAWAITESDSSFPLCSLNTCLYGIPPTTNRIN